MPHTFSLPFDIPTTMRSGITYALIAQPGTLTGGGPITFSTTWNGQFNSLSGAAEGTFVNGGFLKSSIDTTVTIVRRKLKQISSPFQDYKSLVFNDRPSYYWSLDDTGGTVAAELISGAHGTISGGVALGQSGAVGKSMSFDGVDDKITTAYAAASLQIAFTLEVWVKTTKRAAAYMTCFTGRLSGEPYYIFAGVNNNVAFAVIDGAFPADGVKDIADGNWHHLIYACNGTMYMLYVDGILERSSALIRTIATTNSIGIGYEVVAGREWQGNIDEVAIYPYALSATQISAHYRAKAVPPNSYASLIMGDNPSNYWQLDEEGGLVATDIKGGKNGVISGGVVLNQAGIGKSMQFDGVDDKITTIVKVPVIVTIEAWAKLTSGTYNAIIASYGTGGFFIGVTTGAMYYNDAVSEHFAYGFPTSDGQWHHLIWVITTTTVQMYRDGQLVYTSAQGRTQISPNNTIIGWAELSGTGFNGNIDEVAIYPYALTASQIRNHYLFKVAPPNSYADVIMKSGPTNYWQLDEEGGLVANDLVGGKHGTISGGVTLAQSGIGKSMLFDGASGKITTSQSATLTIPLTFECWFKCSVGGEKSLFGVVALNNWLGIAFQGNSSHYHIIYADLITEFRDIPIPGFTFVSNQWYHVTVIFLDKTILTYINGVLVLTDTLSKSLKSSLTATFQIPEQGTFYGTWYAGNLDEVAIYNRALSASEIQSHYLAKFGITNPSSYAAKVLLSSPSNYWRLNELSGTTATDIVGAANGVISGGVTLNGESGMTFNGAGQVATSSVSIPLVCTIEGWIRPTADGNVPFFANPDSTGNAIFVGRVFGSTFIRIYPNTDISGVGPISLNVWTHLAYVLNGSTVQFYVNGVLTDTKSAVRTVPANGAASIGIGSGIGNMVGGIDDVAIYPRALSASEILAHYNAR